jgi:hypothetical protein
MNTTVKSVKLETNLARKKNHQKPQFCWLNPVKANEIPMKSPFFKII